MVTTPPPVAQAAVPAMPAKRTVERPSDNRTEMVQAVKKNSASEAMRDDAFQTRFGKQERGQYVDIRA